MLCAFLGKIFYVFGVGMGGSGESATKDKEKIFWFSNSPQSIFLLETKKWKWLWQKIDWGLKTTVCPIFVKPVLNIFAVCSPVPRMNLSHTQKRYLCSKNQNYLPEKADLRFFLSCGLRTTIKIIISTFYVIDNLSSCYSKNLCKRNKTLCNKTFYK